MVLASTSTVYGSKYLEYLFPVIKNLFSNSKNILFIPYARPNGLSHKSYTDLVNDTFSQLNMSVFGIDDFLSSITEIRIFRKFCFYLSYNNH